MHNNLIAKLYFEKWSKVIKNFFFYEFFIVLVFYFSSFSLPAFPGAQGGGASSVGGRGGRIIYVENLNNAGLGSLRAAVEATGTRIVVFRVSGVITLTSSLNVRSSYLTVAGQTAPGEGIAMHFPNKGSQQTSSIWNIGSGAHDIVIRYIKIWGDAVANINPSTNAGTVGIMIYGGVYNVIMDHCESLWNSSMGLEVYADQGTSANNGKVTFSWNLTGEAVRGSTGSSQSTCFQMISRNFDGATLTDVDAHHNLLVSCNHRNFSIDGTGRIVNNLIYNYARGTDVNTAIHVSKFDFIGNQYKSGLGSNSHPSGYGEIMFDTWGSATAPSPTYYFANNISDWHTSDGTASDGGWSQMAWAGTSGYQSAGVKAPSTWKRSPWVRLPPPASGIDITPDAISGNSLLIKLSAAGGVGDSKQLNNDGTWSNRSNSARDRILAYVAAGTGPSSPPSSAASANGGSLPTLASGTPYTDSDHDGMSDAWETKQGLNPKDPSDGPKLSKDGSGYTNVEKFLNGSANPPEIIKPDIQAINAQPLLTVSPILFSKAIRIQYGIKKSGKIKISIYNIAGEKIKDIIDGNYDAGLYDAFWEGNNNRNKSVSYGIYYVLMRQQDKFEYKSAVLIR